MPTPRDKFAAGLLDVLTKWLLGRLSDRVTAQRLRKAADYLDAMSKPPEPKQQPLALDGEPDDATSDVGKVFSHWQRATKRPSARLTAGRRQKIKARLEHFKPEQLIRVIDWAANNDFFQGDNDRHTRYDRIGTLFRSDEKVERYLELSGPEQEPLHTDPETARLEREMSKALEAGDNEGYERINLQLAHRLNQ